MDEIWLLTLVLALIGTTTSLLVLLAGIMIGKGKDKKGYLYYTIALILTFISYFLYTTLWVKIIS
jgi:hypothetical protein